MPKHPSLKSLCCALMALGSMPVQGAALYLQENVAFSLGLGRDEMELTRQGSRIEVVSSGYRLSLRERLPSGLELGADLLQTSTVLNNHPLAAGLRPGGPGIGLSARITLAPDSLLPIDLAGQYSYQQLKDSNETQTLEITWHRWQASLGSHWQLAEHLSLAAGGTVGGVNADETATGTVSQNTTLEEIRDSGYYLNFEIATSNSGRVGLSWYDGLSRQATLYFQHRY